MKVVVASDHKGFEYKAKIIEHLLSKNIEVTDAGTNSCESCDYPIYAQIAGKKVANHEVDFGVLVCSSAQGIAIAANKVKGVRAGIGYNDEVSALLRRHNDGNMIAFGSSFMEINDILRRIDIFLDTPFEGGRHERRIKLIE